MTLSEKIKTVNNKVEQKKAQYDFKKITLLRCWLYNQEITVD